MIYAKVTANQDIANQQVGLNEQTKVGLEAIRFF